MRTRTSGQGRPKGSRNKITAALKDMVLAALNDVGGQEYLAARAHDNPAAFLQLLGKILPMQVSGEGGGPVVIQVVSYADTEPSPNHEGQ